MSPDFFKNHNYINRGIGGQTTGQIKIRFWQDVIKLQATKVIILGGINDIAQNQGFVPIIETAQNIKDMSEMTMDQGIDVIICSLLPSNYIPWRPSLKPADAVIELNNLLQGYAIQNDLKYVDYYSEMVNEDQGMIEAYTYDGVHCTLEGYKVMERIITPILNE